MSLKFKFIAFVETRADARDPVCKVGNKFCGKKCVSMKSKCASESDEDVHNHNAMTLYRDYDFEQASKDMSKAAPVKGQPKMDLAKARQYHRESSQAIVRNMWEDGKNPNKAIADVNKKYGFK